MCIFSNPQLQLVILILRSDPILNQSRFHFSIQDNSPTLNFIKIQLYFHFFLKKNFSILNLVNPKLPIQYLKTHFTIYTFAKALKVCWHMCQIFFLMLMNFNSKQIFLNQISLTMEIIQIIYLNCLILMVVQV